MDSADAFAALYRDAVLDHGRAPRGVGELAAPTRRAERHNALCGDGIRIDLQLDAHGRITGLRHQTSGCLLCTASASMMSEDVAGLGADAVAARRQALQAAIAGGGAEGLGALAALTGVAATPSRHRCVLLPWEALEAALANDALRPAPETTP